MALPPFRGKEGIRIANRRLTPLPRPEESRFRQYVAFSTRSSREPSRHFRRDVLGALFRAYRVLRAHGQMNRRGRARPPRASGPPHTHIATRPGDVWCWDVTFLPAPTQGHWFYLYLILDLYSRKIVGFEVHDTDSAEHAAHLARRTALAEGVHAKPVRPVLHGDNGATLKATTVLAMLHWLGIKPSYSRPRVSDDNAFAEALFRTAKYRPEFPLKGFADLEAARQWAARFVQWYNHEHRHSGIRYVTPAQRHAGQDGRLLAARHAVYQDARRRNPQRWSGQTRNWTPVGVVTLVWGLVCQALFNARVLS